MARETVYRCDECGEYASAAEVTQILHRAATDTTQNYRNAADLCPKCLFTTTVARVLELGAERDARHHADQAAASEAAAR